MFGYLVLPQQYARLIVFCLACLTFCAASGKREPFSAVPVGQRNLLSKRLSAYVEYYKTRTWEKLYDLVSETGKGGVNKQTFKRRIKEEHGTDFANNPDLLEFIPDRSDTESDSKYLIYGCAKANREGMTFSGIAVIGVVHEHENWFFTGWTFTSFPNESCKALMNPDWKPLSQIGFDKPMDELR